MKKLIIVLFFAIFACSIVPAQIKVVLVQDFEQMKANGIKNTPAVAKRTNVRNASTFNATEAEDEEQTSMQQNSTNDESKSDASNVSTNETASVKDANQKVNTPTVKTKAGNSTTAVEKKSTAPAGSDYVKRLRERQKAAKGGK